VSLGSTVVGCVLSAGLAMWLRRIVSAPAAGWVDGGVLLSILIWARLFLKMDPARHVPDISLVECVALVAITLAAGIGLRWWTPAAQWHGAALLFGVGGRTGDAGGYSNFMALGGLGSAAAYRLWPDRFPERPWRAPYASRPPLGLS
jgi:hypothetical protein